MLEIATPLEPISSGAVEETSSREFWKTEAVTERSERLDNTWQVTKEGIDLGGEVGPNRRNAFAWPHTFHGNPDRIRRTVGERNVSRIFPSRSADPVPPWRQPVCSPSSSLLLRPFQPFPRPASVAGSGSIAPCRKIPIP